MENENTGPTDLYMLRLYLLIIPFFHIKSFGPFYARCIFVPVPKLTYFLCSEYILLKLDLNVTSISSCFRRVKYFSLAISGEESCLKSA